MSKTHSSPQSRLVYDSDRGKMCPTCRQPIAQCTCRQQQTAVKTTAVKATAVKSDGIVRVSRQTKGRKGKGVTVITGLPLHPDGLAQLAKELKQACGSGGTVRDGTIEIQGDHRDRLVAELSRRGYTAKRAGG